MAEDQTLSQSNMESIDKVVTTLQRLARLNRSLLLISKIENQQYGAVDKVDINELLKGMVFDYQDLAEIRSLSVVIDEEDKCVVMMNKDLATILISNLLKNAINHNIGQGTVRVLIEQDRISFLNSGKSQPLDPKKIFERFRKGSNSKNSTGLGLAIVDSIATLYGFGLYYSYLQNLQHRFIVIFTTTG